jgi:hypothetical protein
MASSRNMLRMQSSTASTPHAACRLLLHEPHDATVVDAFAHGKPKDREHMRMRGGGVEDLQ